ncbi:MAG: VOC family protein [Pirellula sp.]
MGTQLKQPAGNFSWFELGTSDQAGAKEFYSKYFGWSFRDSPLPPEMGGVYTTWLLGDKEVGAAYQLGKEMTEVPPHWMTYINVDSADDIAAKAVAHGGTVVAPAFDVMEHGRMAVIQDPTGATFGVWQPRNHLGVDLFGAPGTVCWTELATSDMGKAESFYSSVFGWTLKQSEIPGMDYTEFSNGGKPIGGLMKLTDHMVGVPSHWGIYFMVEDCDAMASKATELGATVCVQPQDIPNTGRFAVIQDPQGAAFMIFKPAM